MLAWLVLAYAGIGAVLLVVALLIGGPLMARVDRLTSAASGSMDAAAEAASAAATSFTGIDASLTQAQRSTDRAANLSRDAAGSMDSLANAMGINLLGTQPLLPLADDFKKTAGQLRDLADSLGGIGQALSTNQADVSAVGVQLDRLAQELDELRGGIGQERAGASPPLSWLFYGFLAWQLLPIVASAVAARLLLARTVAAE